MKNITIVHPEDGDLKFLQKVIDELSNQIGVVVQSLKLNRSVHSHNLALETIGNLNEEELLCFFCHGRSTGLLSCKYTPRGEFSPVYAISDNDGLWIHNENISAIRGKKIFCLACNSNDIAQLALQNGVKVFIGFNNINFDIIQNGEYLNRLQVEQKTKFILRKCVHLALSRGLSNNWNFYQLFYFLKLLLDKYSDNIILNNKSILKGEGRVVFDFLENKKCSNHAFHHRYKSIALCLQEIKDGMKLWGNGNLLLSNFRQYN